MCVLMIYSVKSDYATAQVYGGPFFVFCLVGDTPKCVVERMETECHSKQGNWRQSKSKQAARVKIGFSFQPQSDFSHLFERSEACLVTSTWEMRVAPAESGNLYDLPAETVGHGSCQGFWKLQLLWSHLKCP